jgi:hypothetical protein
MIATYFRDLIMSLLEGTRTLEKLPLVYFFFFEDRHRHPASEETVSAGVLDSLLMTLLLPRSRTISMIGNFFLQCYLGFLGSK